MILIPGFPLIPMILVSQVINGIMLPFVLIFMALLINKPKLMRERINSRFYNAVVWLSVILLIGLALALIPIAIQQMRSGG